MTYYKVIDGVRYDRALLDRAEELVSGTGDGRISTKDAQELYQAALDGRGITITERRTLQYIVDQLNWTSAALNWLEDNVNLDTAPSITDRVKTLIRSEFELTGLTLDLDEEEVFLQTHEFSNTIAFLPAFETALRAIIESDFSGRYTPREAIRNIFQLFEASEAELRAKMKETLNHGSQMVLVPYRPDVEAIVDLDERDEFLEQLEEELDRIFPTELESVQNNWIFYFTIEDISFFGWAIIPRFGDRDLYVYGDNF